MNATIVVTMDLSTLMGGLKAASLDTGETITGDQARRWACEAGIIPAVLGGKSQVLDLGRTRRFHTKCQRIAMALEQGGCTAEGCDWPPGLCHAHHEIPWSLGGGTSVEGRPAALPPPPRPGPRPPLRDDEAPRREGRLQPADLGRPGARELHLTTLSVRRRKPVDRYTATSRSARANV